MKVMRSQGWLGLGTTAGDVGAACLAQRGAASTGARAGLKWWVTCFAAMAPPMAAAMAGALATIAVVTHTGQTIVAAATERLAVRACVWTRLEASGRLWPCCSGR